MENHNHNYHPRHPCFNCWKPDHYTSSCPSPNLSFQKREVLRLRLGIPMPKNTSFERQLKSAYCTNCWLQGDHVTFFCPDDNLDIKAREELRVKQNAPLFDAWRKKLESVSIEPMDASGELTTPETDDGYNASGSAPTQSPRADSSVMATNGFDSDGDAASGHSGFMKPNGNGHLRILPQEESLQQINITLKEIGSSMREMNLMLKMLVPGFMAINDNTNNLAHKRLAEMEKQLYKVIEKQKYDELVRVIMEDMQRRLQDLENKG